MRLRQMSTSTSTTAGETHVHQPSENVLKEPRPLWGYELWAAFVVASLATGGSIFYPEIAGFTPCEFCWYQRICMYPLSILTLFLAAHADNRAVRYILPLPVAGAGISIYHMLIAYGAITEPSGCQIGNTAIGCNTQWIKPESFGYLTIPTLALTGFLLVIAFLTLATLGTSEETATLAAHAER